MNFHYLQRLNSAAVRIDMELELSGMSVKGKRFHTVEAKFLFSDPSKALRSPGMQIALQIIQKFAFIPAACFWNQLLRRQLSKT